MKVLFIWLVGIAVSIGGCEDDVFDSFRSDADVYYYNQITSNNADDDNALTVDFFVEGDDTDSVSGQGYSTDADAEQLSVRIDEDSNEDNSVRMRGESQTGATLFSERTRLSNDTAYTAVSYGDTGTGSIDLAVFRQDTNEPESGSARYRIINTVNMDILNTFSFNIRENGDENNQFFAEDLRMGEATDYQTTNSGGLNLVIAENGPSNEEIITRVDCSLSGGRAYDVILAVQDPLNLPTNVDDADGELVIYCHPHERRASSSSTSG